MITVSIVSHGHGALVERLVCQLVDFPEVVSVILTLNIPESITLPEIASLRIINNETPKGFGANHNAAFDFTKTRYFCVLNPDIEFQDNPFGALISSLDSAEAWLGAPMVVNSQGVVQDSMRQFPTLWRLFKKLVFGDSGLYEGREGGVRFPDWVAGMFMLFRSADFARVGGFDEGYYLYYEDVDICARIWRAGGRVAGDDHSVVVHDARRESRRRLRFMMWHARSMIRFLFLSAFRLPR